MPAAPYTPSKQSIIAATLTMRMNGQTLMNTMHYQPDGSETGTFSDGAAVLDDFATKIDEAGVGWSFLMGVFTSTVLEMVELKLQFVYPVRYAYKTYPAATALGTQPGDALPQNVAAALTFQSNRAGRHEHGTLKIGGLPSSAVVGGNVDGPTRAHISSLGDFLKETAEIPAAGFTYKGIIYRRTSPSTSSDISHNSVGTSARVNRRRTVGLGI